MAHSTPLHVVTGKGGTGKTTVAAALAHGPRRTPDKRVLLCEVEGRQGIAQLFDVPPLPYEERKIAVGLGGGEVYALAIDPEAALLEYLQMYYRLGRAGKALDSSASSTSPPRSRPGVRDVLLTGKVYEAARRARTTSDGFVYDAVVMDAPPTGRIARFLDVNDEVAGLAKVGPIKTPGRLDHGDDAQSRSTPVHLVTLLEEMPVQETLDGIAELTPRRASRSATSSSTSSSPRCSASDTARPSTSGRSTAKAVAPALERARPRRATPRPTLVAERLGARRAPAPAGRAARQMLERVRRPVVELPAARRRRSTRRAVRARRHAARDLLVEDAR